MTVTINKASSPWLKGGLRAALLAGVATLLVACGGDSDCTAPPAFEGEPVGECDGGGSSAPRAADLSLTLSATSLSNDGSSTIIATATAVDSNRNTLAEIPVTISPDNNASATPSSTVTNEKGVVTAEIGIGADRSSRSVTVTATSGRLSRTATFQIIGANLTATPLPAVIAPGAPGRIDFRLVDVNSNPMASQAISITGLGAVSGTTDSNGSFSYSYVAPTAVASLEITATAGGVSVTQPITVASGTGTIPPAMVTVRSPSLSASPSVVSVNTSTTNNRAELRALFVGDGNVRVKNVRVRFDLNGDANNVGGTITSGTNVVYSDDTGVAAAAYVPGAKSSPGNGGLTVRACWSESDFPLGACPNTSLVTLDVVDQPFSISPPGFNNLIEIGPSGLDYVKRYVIQVSDNVGNAKAGVQVSASVDLTRYFKGEWQVVGDKWVKVSRGSCDNEDLNRNGVNEIYENGAVEDANGNKTLDPQRASVVLSFEGSNVTNASGQVVLKIAYPQSLASWFEFNIQVTASGVGGTESRSSFSGVLPVLAAAVSDTDVEPAFRLAPYGTQTSPVVLTTNPAGQSGLLCTSLN
jgi:hypothetical protein